MSTSTTPKQSALDLIDSRPLTRNQKNLVALAVVGNISEFFDIFLIGFVVSVLTKPWNLTGTCLLYTSPSPRDQRGSRMPSSA